MSFFTVHFGRQRYIYARGKSEEMEELQNLIAGGHSGRIRAKDYLPAHKITPTLIGTPDDPNPTVPKPPRPSVPPTRKNYFSSNMYPLPFSLSTFLKKRKQTLGQGPASDRIPRRKQETSSSKYSSSKACWWDNLVESLRDVGILHPIHLWKPKRIQIRLSAT